MYQNNPLESESSILISIEDFMVSTCHEQFVDDHEEFRGGSGNLNNTYK